MLSTLIERCMKRRGVKDTDPYDWEKSENTQQSSSNITNSNNFTTNIHSQIKTVEHQHGTNSVDTDLVPLANTTTNQIALQGPIMGDPEYVSIHILNYSIIIIN